MYRKGTRRKSGKSGRRTTRISSSRGQSAFMDIARKVAEGQRALFGGQNSSRGRITMDNMAFSTRWELESESESEPEAEAEHSDSKELVSETAYDRTSIWCRGPCSRIPQQIHISSYGRNLGYSDEEMKKHLSNCVTMCRVCLARYAYNIVSMVDRPVATSIFLEVGLKKLYQYACYPPDGYNYLYGGILAPQHPESVPFSPGLWKLKGSTVALIGQSMIGDVFARMIVESYHMKVIASNIECDELLIHKYACLLRFLRCIQYEGGGYLDNSEYLKLFSKLPHVGYPATSRYSEKLHRIMNTPYKKPNKRVNTFYTHVQYATNSLMSSLILLRESESPFAPVHAPFISAWLLRKRSAKKESEMTGNSALLRIGHHKLFEPRILGEIMKFMDTTKAQKNHCRTCLSDLKKNQEVSYLADISERQTRIMHAMIGGGGHITGYGKYYIANCRSFGTRSEEVMGMTRQICPRHLLQLHFFYRSMDTKNALRA